MSFKTQISPKLVSLIFSVLIICFAVSFYIFAWEEPISDAPEDNVSAPLNVSVNPQIKDGRLSVNMTGGSSDTALEVANGYLRITNSADEPLAVDCDEDSERGRMIWDYTNDRLYICDGVDGWKYKTFDNI